MGVGMRAAGAVRMGIALAGLLAAAAWPKVAPNGLFTSEMVLQHGMALPVWGTAAAGEKITVRISGQAKTAVADANGAWKVKLDSLAVGGPLAMSIEGVDTVALTNVMVGEVWLCSGQSNMTIGLGSCGYDAKIEAAGRPDLRLFSRKSDIPGSGPWKACSPASAQGFPATAFFYGRYLQDSLQMPVGIIVGAVGATLVEQWMSTRSVLDDPDLDTSDVFAGGSDGGFADGKKAGGLYRNVIEPLVPFAIRGMAWYQGEWNTNRGAHPEKYQGRFKELIDGWRTAWGQGSVPFQFVQLPNFKSTDAWPEIREAQRLTRRNVPGTAMAIAIDLGGVAGFPDSTELHPKNKKDVGYRLALLALADTYKRPIAAPSGPLFKSMSVRNDTARLVFDYAGSGLMAKDGMLKGFEIAASNDTNFTAASYEVAGKDILVYKPGSKIARVRYAWASAPIASLYNKEGLPASPFQTYASDVTGLAFRGKVPMTKAPAGAFDAAGRKTTPHRTASPRLPP